VASWPGAVSILPSISGTALPADGAWRPLALPLANALAVTRPRHRDRRAAGERRRDEARRAVERDGRSLALRSEDGALALPPGTRASYSVDNWLLAAGDDRDAEAASANGPFRCDLLGCIGKVKGKPSRLSAAPRRWKRTAGPPPSSSPPFSVGNGCRAARVVVDRHVLQTDGDYAFYIVGLSIRSAKASPRRADVGPGCRNVRPRSRPYQRARLTPVTGARPKMTTTTASTAIRMSEIAGPSTGE